MLPCWCCSNQPAIEPGEDTASNLQHSSMAATCRLARSLPALVETFPLCRHIAFDAASGRSPELVTIVVPTEGDQFRALEAKLSNAKFPVNLDKESSFGGMSLFTRKSFRDKP